MSRLNAIKRCYEALQRGQSSYGGVIEKLACIALSARQRKKPLRRRGSEKKGRTPFKYFRGEKIASRK